MTTHVLDKHAISLVLVGCESNMLHLLSDVLTSVGFAVTTVHADEAVEACLDLAMPAAIIYDELRGVFDAEDLFDELRKKARWATIPFVLLSDDCDDDRVARCLNAGMEDVVPKPFAIAECHARICKAVRHHIQLRRPLADDIGLMGHLDCMELPDLIMNLHQNARTGMLELRDEASSYRFFFVGGELTHAQGPRGISGRKALFRAIRCAEGTFSFLNRVGAEGPPDQGLTSPTHLVLCAVQEADEFSQARARLPRGPVSLSGKVSRSQPGGSSILAPLQSTPVKMVSIDALIDASPETDLDAARQLYECLKKETLVANHPTCSTAR